jgi:septal ring factor EnvC (AmiA/AmiB activator)
MATWRRAAAWWALAGSALCLIGCAAQPDYNDVVTQRDEARRALVAVQGSISAAKAETQKTAEALTVAQAALAMMVQTRDQLEAAKAELAQVKQAKEASDAKAARLQEQLAQAELDRDRTKKDLTAIQRTAAALQAKVAELEAKSAAPPAPSPSTAVAPTTETGLAPTSEPGL